MSEQPQPNADVRAPSEEELFYIAWGRETVKANINVTSSVLRQFITINVALLAGGAAFLGTTTTPPWLRVVILLSFLIGLVLAILGVLPTSSKVNLQVPAEIKRHKLGALQSKRRFLKLSACCTVFGLLVSAWAMSGLRVCF